MIELVRAVKEPCVIVGVSTRNASRSTVEDSLEELTLLADTAGAIVMGRFTQDRDRIDPATFIGKGKVEELCAFVTERNIPLVIFDDDLSAVQVRNLERVIQCKVIDRSALILDIFAARAKSMESKTQVELAQLEYLLPRLTRQWTHLSKQYGGVGTKGPGETQIETDRRMVRARISHLKEKLERIGRQRITQRKGRTKHLRAALVGYTNAGKSTLLNLLSGSGVFVEDRLFATLDPTTRIVPLTTGINILMTDTVGFIRKLPPTLVASFKSTLEEITEADMVIHLVDLSAHTYNEQIHVVRETLEELGAHEKPTLIVFNKIDRLTDRGALQTVAADHANPVFISAIRGINILGLKDGILQLMDRAFTVLDVAIPQHEQKLISYLHTVGEVQEILYDDLVARLKVRVPKSEEDRLLRLVHGTR
ncbi:MAG: GTPase HflX [Ignavibacteria bacterium]|nr:GTPase HflX [Ignavibacteria bacterium]